MTILAVAAAVLGMVVLAAFLLDPYDTGRSSLLSKPGVRPQGPRTASASRGRDPAFDAAIVGNSHIQLLSPERLTAATGDKFVQLAVPATGPKEQLALLDWFMRSRRGAAKALVLSADTMWCTSDETLANEKPFPFWLLSRSLSEYVRGLVRYDILEEIPRRIGYVLDPDSERARPDGYWDYEANYIGLGYDRDPTLRERLRQRPHRGEPRFDRDPLEGQRRFPAAERLRDFASGLPADLALVVVFPPTYVNSQPQRRTEAAYLDEACKAAISQAARTHGKSAVLDWRQARSENRNENHFFDMTHYRQPIARLVEADIARALADLK